MEETKAATSIIEHIPREPSKKKKKPNNLTANHITSALYFTATERKN